MRASALSGVVWVASKSGLGATHNIIKNCIIAGNGATTLAGIVSSSGITLGSPAEAPDSNNTYQNNAVNSAQFGICLFGPVGNESGNVVTGNLVGSSTPGPRSASMALPSPNRPTRQFRTIPSPEFPRWAARRRPASESAAPPMAF